MQIEARKQNNEVMSELDLTLYETINQIEEVIDTDPKEGLKLISEFISVTHKNNSIAVNRSELAYLAGFAHGKSLQDNILPDIDISGINELALINSSANKNTPVELKELMDGFLAGIVSTMECRESAFIEIKDPQILLEMAS